MANKVLEHGYGAPFVGLYYEKGDKLIKLTSKVSSFKYEYDEEEDDTCILVIETDRREDADEPWYQEKAQLNVGWGWSAERGNEWVSNNRKVYIQEVKWQFTETNIKVTLTCTEKAVSMKYTGSSMIHKGVSILQVSQYMAQKHGLRAFIELDTPFVDKIQLQPRGGESLDQYLIRRQLSQIDKVDPSSINKYTPEQLKNYKLGLPNPIKQELLGDMTEFNAKLGIKVYNNLPQANKTDAQFLAEAARREQELFPTSHDDELIIKRRNFSQAPYKSYTYGGTLGDLQSFTPESKNRSKKGNSVNRQFGGWNAGDKTFFSGDANGANSNSPLLNHYIEQLRLYKLIQKYPGGGIKIAGFSQSKVRHIFIDDNNIRAKGDKALDYTLRDRGLIPVTVDDKVSALEKALGAANDIIKDHNQSIYDPRGEDAIDAYVRANHGRENAELKKNPASATMWGDPLLKVGKIITIIGVSQKYSGNYYITKCSHEITFSGGYMVDLELVRQGVNIKSTDDHVNIKEVGRVVNKQVGPDAVVPTTILPVIMNPATYKFDFGEFEKIRKKNESENKRINSERKEPIK